MDASFGTRAKTLVPGLGSSAGTSASWGKRRAPKKRKVLRDQWPESESNGHPRDFATDNIRSSVVESLLSPEYCGVVFAGLPPNSRSPGQTGCSLRELLTAWNINAEDDDCPPCGQRLHRPFVQLNISTSKKMTEISPMHEPGPSRTGVHVIRSINPADLVPRRGGTRYKPGGKRVGRQAIRARLPTKRYKRVKVTSREMPEHKVFERRSRPFESWDEKQWSPNGGKR
ncbi:hypothetical protein C8R47DRAFT_1080504 [Mycena vitilis]|nr:hypothetical protein C8R47DRAFT_1080504 [Mycena vitilis]